MRALRTVKNAMLSLFGLGVVWFGAVTLPHWIAHSDYKLFPLRMGNLRFVGWIPIVLGVATILWCYGMFVFVGDGTPWPFSPPRRLVVTGPYRLLRNPMESGFLLAVFGEMLLLESSALLLYLAFSFLVLYIRQVAFEEPILRSRFGQAYEEYCGPVPRYVPLLRSGIEGE